MSAPIKLSVAAPAFNEAEGIEAVVTEWHSFLSGCDDVAEFEIVDAKIFQEFSAGNTKGVTDAGGRFVSRRGTTYSMAGEPPKTIALVAWDSFEQAEAYYKSETWKNLAAVRDKGAKFRAYLVEGTK